MLPYITIRAISGHDDVKHLAGPVAKHHCNCVDALRFVSHELLAPLHVEAVEQRSVKFDAVNAQATSVRSRHFY